MGLTGFMESPARREGLGWAVLVVLFFLVRGTAADQLRGTVHFNGLVLNQFAIAESMDLGRGFAWDQGKVEREARNSRAITYAQWLALPGTGPYTVFPARDVPGLAWIIHWTNRILPGPPTDYWAWLLQTLLEAAALMGFLFMTAELWGFGVAFGAGLLYLLGYPYLWSVSFQAMSDGFAIPIYVSVLGFLFILTRRTGGRRFWGMAALLVLGSILLWVRPTPAYFFWMMVPVALAFRSVPLRERLSAAFLLGAVPAFLFWIPYGSFNQNHYGTRETYFLGSQVWEGLGSVGENPYGFKVDDSAMVPWVRARGIPVEVQGDPRMNRELWDYSWSVIRKDPGYYLRNIRVRLGEIIRRPLRVMNPGPESPGAVRWGELGWRDLLKRPWAGLFRVLNWAYFKDECGKGFVWLGGAALLGLLAIATAQKPFLVLWMAPLFYVMIPQVLIYFEPRYLAVAAWVLVVPISMGLNLILGKWRKKPCAE